VRSNAQAARQSEQGPEGGAPLSPFQHADVRAVQAGLEAKGFLRKALPFAELSDSHAERLFRRHGHRPALGGIPWAGMIPVCPLALDRL